jgi:hypothetical protein
MVRLSALARAGDPAGEVTARTAFRLAGKGMLLLACGAVPWLLILWAFGVF